MGRMFALADDLTGAAETAAALMSPARPARIALSGVPEGDAPVFVADLDCRHHPRAYDLVREALLHSGDRRVFVKVDSLLRGDVAATVAACLDAPVVFAPALPSAGRTVVGGVPYIEGVPLRETRAWRAEPRPAPASVAEALGDVPWVHAPPGADLAEVAAAGQVAVCDAETDADLDAIVAAALRCSPRTRLVGSGGLATALGPALGGNPGRCAAPRGNGRLLVVVGTAEPGAAEQVGSLIGHGFSNVALDAEDLGATGPAPPTAARLVRDALAAGPAVLTVRGPAPPTLTRTLGEIVREALGGLPADLVLTGGETARKVLDALGVRELIPLDQVHHGAVHSRTPQGHSVVTRPGSFGDADSLLRMAAHLSDSKG
ncbi:four-carbon acid sugar kinase family protein [Nonomuraea sp. NPDC049400]|uniref:four-carbon acid sugar kinase family protein n=1 Tax=Nonomuraea sp. NPDC049400 TaxID=3364352 RepID=UPI0037A992D9